MRASEPLELAFWDTIKQFEKENHIPYMSIIEDVERRKEVERIKSLIKSLIKHRLGELDDALSSVIEPLAKLPSDEIANLLLTSSLEEILARFGQSTVH